MTKQSVYNRKAKWMRALIKLASRVTHLTEGYGKDRPLEITRVTNDLWLLGARGELIWDDGFALSMGPDWLHDIGDHLGLVEKLSGMMHDHANKVGYGATLDLYVNYKCVAQREITI